MNTRSWAVYGSVAVAVVMVAGVSVFSATGSAPASLQTQTHADLARHSPASHVALSPVRHWPDTSTVKAELSSAPQTLRMDAALGPHEEPKASEKTIPAAPQQAVQSKLASADSVALNLRVPQESDSGDALQDANESGPTPPADNPDGGKTDRQAMLKLKRRPPPVPEVESLNIFNPEYGLRGFMKQSWVSNSFGVQGGLGFNNGERIRSNSGKIRDEIAVGMGVMMAF